MILKKITVFLLLQAGIMAAWAQTTPKAVPDSVMQRVYEQVKTPYKYGLVVVPADNGKKLDCPTVLWAR